MSDQEEIRRNIKSNKEVLRFRETAKKFCEFIETHKSYRKKEFLTLCAMSLSELYNHALSLRQLISDGEDDSVPQVQHDEWASLSDSLKQKLGDDDVYTVVFDPTNPEPDDPVEATLSDDLADIYRDLKNGLMFWDSDSQSGLEEALWEWSFGFEHHWGQHLTKALSAIHWLICLHLPDDYEQAG
jgi:hypothetical protein